MPDTSKMTPDEFTVGQTVFVKSPRKIEDIGFTDFGPLTIVAIDGDEYWLKKGDTRYTRKIDALAATDPSQPAEPVAQVCPFCWSDTAVYESDGVNRKHWVCCKGHIACWFTGPRKPTRLEAIAAWNSIGILSVPARTPAPLHSKEEIERAFRDNKVGELIAKQPEPKPPCQCEVCISVREAIAAEREECAKIADANQGPHATSCVKAADTHTRDWHGWAATASAVIANMIRKRGQP